MGVISARLGAITTGTVQAQVSDITIEYGQESAAYGSSATDRSLGRLKGNTDWRATFKVQNYLGNVFPGDTLTLVAFTGVAGGSFTGAAMCNEVVIEADIKGGGIITATISVESNGLHTRETTTVTDTSVPAPLSVKGLGVTYAGSARTDATSWTLTLKSENQPYHSAATYDLTTDTNFTKRIAGRIDASGSWTELQGLTASLPREGENSSILKLFVTASLFYEIKWVAIENIAVPAPVESAGLVEATIGWSFNGASAGVKGFMNKPDLTAFWP